MTIGMAVTTSSGILAESLAALSRTAHQAFADVENQARLDVAQATASAREARLERDSALAALSAAQLEHQKLQNEVAIAKAALKQAEISSLHQKETISQLRREAAQWKDQSQNWQEHFLRVEQERCSLNSRVDELLAGSLRWTQTIADRFTPNHLVESPPLSRIKRTSPLSNQQTTRKLLMAASPPDVDSPPTSAHKADSLVPRRPRKSKHLNAAPLKRPSHEDYSSAAYPNSPDRLNRPQPTVLRRVQAVVNIKKEESDEELEGKDEHFPRRLGKKQTRRISSESDRDSGTSDQSYREDDDDELMLGAEDTHEVQSQDENIAKDRHPSSSPNKKRKFVNSSGRNKLTGHKV